MLRLLWSVLPMHCRSHAIGAVAAGLHDSLSARKVSCRSTSSPASARRHPSQPAQRAQHAPCRCCARLPSAAAAARKVARVTGGSLVRRQPLSLPGSGSGRLAGWGKLCQGAAIPVA